MTALDQVSRIGAVAQHLVDRRRPPEGWFRPLHSGLVGNTVLLFVGSRTGDPFAVEYLRDLVRPDPAAGHLEHSFHHGSRFRVDDQMSSGVRVLAVSVQRKGSDVLPLSPLVVQHRADVIGQVLQIPLIDQAVDLTGFLVGAVVGIHMIHHRDEAYPPLDELAVQVLFHQLHVPGKTGLGLGQHHIEPVLTGSFDHRVEGRTVPVDARIVLIRIDLVDIKTFLDRVLDQHRLLVLDALRFTGLVFILLAQTAVNSCSHRLHLSFRCNRLPKLYRISPPVATMPLAYS